MADVTRVNSDGHQEVRTGLGWRKVSSHASTDATALPVIDLRDLTSSDQDRRRAVAKTICDAAASIGFFYVRNHGVPDEAISSILTQSKRFFRDLTLEEKMEFDTQRNSHYYGYYPLDLNPNLPSGAKLNEGTNYGYESACDPEKTSKEQNDDNGENFWPSEERLPGYQAYVKQYMAHMLTLGRSLLRMFALGLGQDEHAFDHLATKPYSILKMTYYPGEIPGTAQPSAIRPHTDYELLTILLQDDIPSLQVLSTTGEWIHARPIPGTFVVNIGDSMSMLTNGLFVSTMHRVVNSSGKDRYSVPFFLGANQDAELKALDKFVTTDNPAKFQPIMSGDYIRRSLQAVYAKLDIEISLESVEIGA